MRPDAQLYWADPVGQLVALRVAVKCLLSRGMGLNERFDRATLPLVKYRPEDFPEGLRPTFARIMQARRDVSRNYIGATLFDFSQLSAPKRRALQSDLIALYEACLLDIGKMSGAASDSDSGFYGIVYPQK
jgi:hypothetical protein